MNGRIYRAFASFVVLAVVFAALPVQSAGAVSNTIVISQVYGGGGNSGATYTHDFIELFNRSTTTVSLTGWSLQYTSATGTGLFGANTSLITPLSGLLAPGQYLLVQEATNAAVGAPLPTPDITDASPIAMAAGAGKVALVNTTTGLGCNGGSTPCSPAALATIVDLVGYGSANFFEGSGPAPTLSATNAGFRAGDGCIDTDDNAADFVAAPVAPRNTASPLHVCPVTPSLSMNDVSLAEGDSGTTTFTFTVSISNPAGANGVTFDIATAGNTATSPDDFAANSLVGQSIPEGSSSYTFDVAVNGDITQEVDETFFVNVTNVTGATVGDAQALGTILDDDTPVDTPVCDRPYTPAYQIQGSGAATPISGTVTTKGVVVGDFEGGSTVGLSGFYLQDAAGDGDAATSDGLFVFNSTRNNVNVGDLVRVTGGVTEFNGLTEVSTPSGGIVNCGTGSVAPVDVTFPVQALTDLEPYEGMLVRLPQPLTISEYFNYDRFGEIVLALPLDGESRAFTPTAIDEPGAPALARALANSLRRITLDDGINTQNPGTLRHPNGDPFSLTNSFRGGDTVENTVGVMSYAFDLYRIEPTEPADYTAVNPRPAAPEPVGGSLRVASMNTLNYFLTLDGIDDDSGGDNSADNICGPFASLECRGADLSQPLEFTRQRDKLLHALAGLEADIIGLNEIENTAGVEPLADIVAGLNDMLGDGTYAFIDTGTIGTDAIRVGLIYKPATVAPVGVFKVLTTAVDPRFVDTANRPVLAQTFEEVATGGRFTVAVNHLKSKGSACSGDPDTGDGQGNCNLTRTAAARALVDWLASDPTGSGDSDFLIVGDLNSYAQEDPIDAIKAGSDDVSGTFDDYTNLIAKYQGTYAYSYVFDGQAGYLDHALASATMVGQVSGAADWHINSDEPDVLDYDTSFKPASQEALYEPEGYRSSDHDPVVVGLNLTAYNFAGFFSPVLNPPDLNIINAGSTVPVKFSLNGDQGLSIFAAGYPQSVQIVCDSGAVIGSPEAIQTTLTYDPLTDTYFFKWKTAKNNWVNTCRRLTVTLTDGTTREAYFRFVK